MTNQEPTDSEMLDWLESQVEGYGNGIIFRFSGMGRGMRLHETSLDGASPTIREAIKDAMGKYEEDE